MGTTRIKYDKEKEKEGMKRKANIESSAMSKKQTTVCPWCNYTTVLESLTTSTATMHIQETLD